MNSYLFPYLLLLAHFVSGALWLIGINRRLDPTATRKQWIKYLTYLAVANLLWFCLLYFQKAFPFLGMILMLSAAVEWGGALRKFTPKALPTFFFLLVLAGFSGFLYLDQRLLLFTCFVVLLFDGSSQIAGQVAGRRKLLPEISPRKTVEGLVGGALVTLATAMLIRRSFSFEWKEFLLITSLLMGSAFLGDLLASLVKRKAGIETFGKILPGHGGVLDRFDSLIMAGAMIFLVSLIQNLSP